MKRFALFVGINTFPGNRLLYARADAEVMHSVFSECYDDTRLLVDRTASTEAILREMRALKRKASPGDLLLFFYSGHGSDGNYERILDIPVYDEKGRFIPDAEGLHTSVIAKASEKPGVHRLFILDCCRVPSQPNSTGKEVRGGAGGRWQTRTLAPNYLERQDANEIPQPTILSASSHGQTSSEKVFLGHGYFTKAILDTLREEDVHCFDDFRNSLGANMKKLQKQLGDDDSPQVASIEGPIDIDLPLWPFWNDVASGHEGDNHPPFTSDDPLATLRTVSSAFSKAASLSRYFYVKSKSIPSGKLEKACNAMGVRCGPARVLALYDNTLFGRGFEGIVIAPEGVYAKNYDEEPMFFHWNSIDKVGYRPGALFINDLAISAVDSRLSLMAKQAVYNGIIEIAEQISGETFGNEDDDDEDGEACNTGDEDLDEGDDTDEEDGEKYCSARDDEGDNPEENEADALWRRIRKMYPNYFMDDDSK